RTGATHTAWSPSASTGTAAPDPGHQDGRPREPLVLGGPPARGLNGVECRRRRPCRLAGGHPRGARRCRLTALLVHFLTTPYAIGRIEMDALHLALQPLALGERGHDLQAVAQDHAVLPVHGMPVELVAVLRVGEPVEIGEEVRHVGLGRAGLLGAALEIVDDRLGVDLLLDVEGRRVDDEVGPVLRVLAAPDELRVADLDLAGLPELLALRFGERDADAVPDDLRVEIRIARPRLALGERKGARQPHLLRCRAQQLFVLLEDRRHLGRRIVDPLVLVAQGLNVLGLGWTGHRFNRFRRRSRTPDRWEGVAEASGCPAAWRDTHCLRRPMLERGYAPMFPGQPAWSRRNSGRYTAGGVFSQ